MMHIATGYPMQDMNYVSENKNKVFIFQMYIGALNALRNRNEK